MRKIFVWILVFAAIAGSTGCSTMQKKFTRQKKEPKHTPATVFIDPTGPYQKKYSNDYYYKTHFTFWTSWHGELMSNLDGNQKKMRRCAEEAWNHLTEMNKYLNEEKQAQLKPIKDDFEKIYQKIERGNFRKSDVPTFRAELEKIGRLVANDFYFNKVQDSLVADKVDLGS